MPQFSYDPNNPEAGWIDTATSGFAEGGRAKKKKQQQKNNGGGSTATASYSSTSSPTTGGKTAAERRAERQAAAKKRREERAAAEAAKRNPLTAPFKTPAQLRKEAAELAAMGVGSEDALRATAAQQQAGLGGLTSALTGTLTGLADRTQAGLAGFGNLYSQLAGAAQSAGQSQAAAAGAPTSIAPGASPTVASNLANLAAPTMGYAPAAAVTGAQMQGAVTANLTKALMDRSSKLSADTAKYLYQLKSDELQRAVSQGTLAQNEARLGLSAQSAAWDQQVDQAKLEQGNQRIAQSWQRIQDSRQKAGGSGAKAVAAVKKTILADTIKLTEPRSVFSGTNTYKIVVDTALGGPQEFTVQGASPEDALASAKAKYPSVASNPDVSTGNLTYVGAVQSQELPKRGEVTTMLVNQLVNAGMSRVNARKWIAANIPGIANLPA
jgi:hypothetical protein